MAEQVWQFRKTNPVSTDLMNWLSKQNILQLFAPVQAARGITTN